MLSPEEFFDYYEKNLRQYESPGWYLVKGPLGGDTGSFLTGIYQKADGKWCFERTQERCNSPYHWEYDTWEELMQERLRYALYSWIKHEAGKAAAENCLAELGLDSRP